MKVTSMTWGSDISLLVEGSKELGIELDAWSARDLEDERRRKDCINSFEHADVILLRLTTDNVWDEFIEELNKNVPIIPLGRNTFFRSLSNVSLETVATVNAYHVYGGAENIKNMLRYIGKEVLGQDYTYDDPQETMWQGIYHPDAETTFASIDEYLQWYKQKLKDKRKSERTVAFILHNNPCASLEATVGSAAHLDALESVARILKRMKAEGYSIAPPEDGKALSENIMNRKAISEFRWTTVDEIVSKGGALAMITKADYENWFDTLTREVKECPRHINTSQHISIWRTHSALM